MRLETTEANEFILIREQRNSLDTSSKLHTMHG